MDLAYNQAIYLMPIVLAVSLWTSWKDMKHMLITNKTVLVFAFLFVAIGWMLMPLPEFGWRFAQFAIALTITFGLNAIGAMGGGDAKFIAAAALYISPGDWLLVTVLLTISLLIATLVVRLAKYTFIAHLTSEWKCWSAGLKLPFGLALGMTMIIYYALPIYLHLMA